jgi:hypothetical protein
MNTRLVRRIIGLILAALLLTGIVILSGTTAAAQGRLQRRVIVVRPIRSFGPFRPYGYPYGRYNYYSQYVFSSGVAAENQGYHDGLKTGSSDARRGQSYNPERSHYFQDAGFGNFAEAYREGFSRGYRDGFES